MILSLFLFFWVLYVEAHCSELIVLFICNILRSSANSSQVGSRTVGLVFSVSICICLLYRGEHLAYSTVQIKKIPFWLSILCSCVCLTLRARIDEGQTGLAASAVLWPSDAPAWFWRPRGVAVALGWYVVWCSNNMEILACFFWGVKK